MFDKTIETKDQAYRFVEMKVLKSVGNFGSGREMLFTNNQEQKESYMETLLTMERLMKMMQ